MKHIAAGVFKAKCLAILNEVAQTHESIIITKRGKPVAKVVPVDKNKNETENPLDGSILYMGDVISPIDVEWEAAKDDPA